MESEPFTLGVEEEYQLVDRLDGALVSAADTVLATDWSNELKGELQQTMLEIGTPVCTWPAEVGASECMCSRDRWIRSGSAEFTAPRS